MNADTIKFNGTDLGGANYKLHIKDQGHPFLPKPKIHVEQLAQADGAIVQGAGWEPRYYKFTAFVGGADETERDVLLANLVNIFKVAQEGEKELELGWDQGTTHDVRLLTGINGNVAVTGAIFSLEFIEPNPTV